MLKGQKVAVMISVLGLFLTHAVLLAHAEDIEKKQEKISVRLVWKSVHAARFIPDGKTFPPPEIQAEIESESTSEVGKRFLINTLREQVAKHDRLVFFEDGKIFDVNEKGHHYLLFSQGGQYVGFVGGTKGMTEEELGRVGYVGDWGPITQLILMTVQGELLWRKVRLFAPIRILENGEVAVPHRTYGRGRGLILYSPTGDTLFDLPKQQATAPSHHAHNSEKPIYAHLDNGYLWVFAVGGKVVLKKKLEGIGAWSVDLSDDGRYIFLDGRKSGAPIYPHTQWLLDQRGRLIREFSFRAPSVLDFSPDGDFLAILDDGKLKLIECSTGEIRREILAEEKSDYLVNTEISRKGNLVLLRNILIEDKNSGVTNWRLRLFDNEGTLLWQETFSPRDRPGHGDVFMADDGSYFLVNSDNSLYCYAVARGSMRD